MEEEELRTLNLMEDSSKMNLETEANYLHCNKDEPLIKGQINETEIMNSNTKINKMDLEIKVSGEVLADTIVENNATDEMENMDELKTNRRDDIPKIKDENLKDNKKFTANNEDDNNKKQHISKIDFSVFEESFYRRYKSFFHNDKKASQIDLSQEKNIISRKINEHFSSFEINPVDVIRTFLVLRKNSEHSHAQIIMSPAQSPEPNVPPISEGNGRSKRCTTKDVNGANPENNDTTVNGEANVSSFKSNYKTENNSNAGENNLVNNQTDNGISTRNSRKGRVSNRGRR